MPIYHSEEIIMRNNHEALKSILTSFSKIQLDSIAKGVFK